ncbi:hypothetical protein AAE478_005990 [Parahypoxylon ruwenzoriense]
MDWDSNRARLNHPLSIAELVERWDDDDFTFDDSDDWGVQSIGGTSTASANPQTHHRDSHSSFRSDRDSLPGNDETQVHLPGDDEKSTLDAIAAASHAGIPIPTNVPPSALVGGTIKRLGGRKMKKIFQEDYGDDLQLPATGPLRLKPQDDRKYPDALRQVSLSSPKKQVVPDLFQEPPHEPVLPKTLGTPINLDRFRDTDDDDDDIFGDGAATIKVSKLRPQIKPTSLITPPTPSPQNKRDEDEFEGDLELPSDGLLKLSRRMDIPKTPALSVTDDFDWGESSLGTRFAGTKRDAFSTRSSSVSALSPSLASSITAESEDELFDGLLLPSGPLDLSERLKRRKQDEYPEKQSGQPLSHKRAPSFKNIVEPTADKEDLLSGLDFGEGDVFSSSKPTLHRNVKVKEARPVSPVRPKTSVSVTFTNRPVTSTPASRLPRPMGSLERAQTHPSLEPVSESGGPIPQRPSRRSQSRLGHSAQSSVSSVHTPTTPSSVQSSQFSTPRRRELNQKASTGALRNEPTTTNAQLLRLKRSLPAMRHTPTSSKTGVPRFDRPPSRTDSRVESGRPQSILRPKTPVDRARPLFDSNAAQSRKIQAPPFLPAGASQAQSQHVAAKLPRTLRRCDSDYGPDLRPLSRTISRAGMRSPSPRRARNEKTSAEPIWQQLSKPRRVRRFGDGHELDSFDDLPTSAQAESKFVKQPVASGTRTGIRNKLYQNVLPDRNTPSPVSPYSPAKSDYQPHFARDTAASRIARETILAQRAPASGPLAPLPSQRVAHLSGRSNLAPHSHHNASRSKRPLKIPQQKPHLISNLNSAKETKGTHTTPNKVQKPHQFKIPHTSEKPQKYPSRIPQTPERLQKLRKPQKPKKPEQPQQSQAPPKPSRIPQTPERLRKLQKPQTAAKLQQLANYPTPKKAQASKKPQAPYKKPPVPKKPQKSEKSQIPQIHGKSLKPRHPEKSQKTQAPKKSQKKEITNIETSVVNGMRYNPATFRWEGNDNALRAFDAPAPSPTTASLPPHVSRDREGSTSRPVLITNMTATKGVKRVGDMVFDPQKMCWLKADSSTLPSDDPMEGFNAIDDDDPFKDIPDLDEKDKDSVSGCHGRGSDLRDDWLVGEEFDVGPEFIRRQHEEESRWRRKCENWSGAGNRNRTDLRWALRKMIMEK